MSIKKPPPAQSRRERYASGKLFLHNGSLGGVLPDGSDAVLAGGLGGIAFGGGNDLAVACLQTEAELAGLVLIQLKLGMQGSLFLRQVGKIGIRSDIGNTLDTLAASCDGGIDLGGGDNFAVAGFQIKLVAGVGDYV